jgi:hypothetical protein
MDRLIASNTVAVGSGDIAPATGTPGQATSGNPATNTPATVLPAYAFNAIQEELIAILAAAGITPDRTNNAQIVSAIKRLVQSQVVLADTGAVNAYAATNAPALTATTWANGIVQQIKVANTNTGTSTYSPDTLAAIPIYGLGLQPLQQGEMFAGGTAILMKQTIAGVNSGNPVAILLECAGGAQQVASSTQSNHAVNQGQVVGVGQTLTNVTASRTSSTAYTNSTGKPIVAYLLGTTTSPNGYVVGWVNGAQIGGVSANATSTSSVSVSFVVPAGATYQVTTSLATLASWYELR